MEPCEWNLIANPKARQNHFYEIFYISHYYNYRFVPPWSSTVSPKLTPWLETPSLCLIFPKCSSTMDLVSRNCYTMRWPGSVVTVCVSFCICTARIVFLDCFAWEFKKPKDDFQKLILEEKCKVAPIDQHVGPLLGIYSQNFCWQEIKVLLSTLRVMWPSSLETKSVMLRLTREFKHH